MHRDILLRLKISLLGAFVLFTLVGMAATSTKALFVGAFALVVLLAFAIASLIKAGHRSA